MLVFFDFETYSELSLPDVGAYRYAAHPSTRPVCLAYAINGDPVKTWEQGQPIPEDLRAALEFGHATFVAHNAAFDRLIWNACEPFRELPLPIERTACSMAQAQASNLLAGLEGACQGAQSRFVKNPDGRTLMSKFCAPGGVGTPEEWARFVKYCADDVEAMRALWLRTRPLTKAEWAEYHASERINAVGLPVDVPFCVSAMRLAAHMADRAAEDLKRITGDEKITPKAYVRQRDWLQQRLTLDQLAVITNDEGKVSVDKESRAALLESGDLAPEVLEFVNALDAAGGAAVAKYAAILGRVSPDDRLRGAFQFNGAGQTGRYSSKGAQLHNIIRKPLVKGKPEAAIHAMNIVCSDAPEEEVARRLTETYEMPVPQILGRLIRPTFAAPPGRDLAWCDYSMIEARVLPWLAQRKEADRVLAAFRRGVDIYVDTAAGMYRVAPEAVTDAQRQEGKVATLALGYAGGHRALASMARNYGMTLDEDFAKEIVAKWRAANPWAVWLWGALNDAAKECVDNPGCTVKVGRVSYQFISKLLGGSLTAKLPSGRLLVYPRARMEVETDPDTGRTYRDVSFMRPFQGKMIRNRLYGGLMAENITQAVSKDLLGAALVALVPLAEERGGCVVGHVHDEVITEMPTDAIGEWRKELEAVMTTNPQWAEGLPLKAEVESGPFWTKIK